MDAFYASVEQRDSPELKSRPVVVGGDPKSRSVVCSASYEARRFGIRSAMPCSQAYRLCPQAIFISPNFDKYITASRQIHAIFKQVTATVEPLALDEAYLDVTENLFNEPIASNIARWIKEQIQQELRMTASAGVGPNKFIAKLASDHKKPDGLVVIPPEKVMSWIEHLPVEKFWGVGPATAKKLHALGIQTASDIRRLDSTQLEKEMGSFGSFLYELAFGRDPRSVEAHSEPKSRGSETTFDKDILNAQTLLNYIESQANELSTDLKKIQRQATTICLKIKYSDFKQISRSQSLTQPSDESFTIAQTAAELLFRDTDVGTRPIRLIGISVSGLVTPDHPVQLCFDFLR